MPWGSAVCLCGAFEVRPVPRLVQRLPEGPAYQPRFENAADEVKRKEQAGEGAEHERLQDKVLDDVVDGVISPESAMRDFGVVISKDLVLDQSATAVLRDSRAS